jgi:hypothetical protein
MTKEDIIRMAREAGGCEYGNANPEIESTFILKDDQIKAFADLVAAAEREACEMAVEDIARKYQKAHEVNAENVADACAYAIRARGNT